MKTHVEFRSDAFPPEEDGADELNPGCIELAKFLSRNLKGKGFETEEPGEEDWGWMVPIKNKDFALWIGCGCYRDENHDDGFLCFIEPHTPTIRRFGFLWKIDVSERVTTLQRALNEVLSEHPGVRDIRWWTYDGFNRPRRSVRD